MMSGGPEMCSMPAISKSIKPMQKKGFRQEKTGFPFPNFVLREHEVPCICRCVFDGDTFYVLNSKDMHILNHNGSFGVSSLTYRGPSYEETSFYLKPYFTKKMEREHSKRQSGNGTTNDHKNSQAGFKKSRFEFIESSELPLSTNNYGGEKNGHHCKPNPFSKSALKYTNIEIDRDYLFEKSMSDCETNGFQMRQPQPNVLLENIKCNIEEERLILMPEEAIFLSFGVGCLTIHSPRGDTLGYRKVWEKLVECNPEFPIAYAVYHYFRSKNWVPKLGDSYGASYLLYKIGPSAFHASYLVHILGFPSRPTPTWNELNAWVRLGCHVSKNVMICEVSVPRRFDVVTSEPRSIFEMTLKETSLFRWKANSGSIVKY